MDRLQELQAQRRRIDADIEDERRRRLQEAHERGLKRTDCPKFDAMTPAQQRHCEFMGFDPDNPDIPLD